MTYEHYIRIDDVGRIIDGFSTFDRQPTEGDILLRSDGGQIFDIRGDGFWRPLWFCPPAFNGLKVYEYAWMNESVRIRTNSEIDADMPPLPPVPSVEEQLQANTEDIETLAEVINIILGVE